MNKLKHFIKTTILGGLVVILPTVILIMLVKWLFGLVQGITNPIAGKIFPDTVGQYWGMVLALLVILGLCFLVGILVRTQLGKWLYGVLESSFMKRIPGYTLIKETVAQFLGAKKSPFSSVALVQLFDNATMVTSFVTDEHTDGSFTVFVPTGPNPTSGNIYHVRAEQVHLVQVSVEDTMRSILSCGAGSSVLIDKLKETTTP